MEISAGVVDAWDRVKVLKGGTLLHAHGEIDVDLSGPVPIYEVRFAYNGSPLTATRHLSMDSAVEQSDRLKQLLVERNWQIPEESVKRAAG